MRIVITWAEVIQRRVEVDVDDDVQPKTITAIAVAKANAQAAVTGGSIIQHGRPEGVHWESADGKKFGGRMA